MRRSYFAVFMVAMACGDDQAPPALPCEDPVLPPLQGMLIGHFDSPIYVTQAPGSTDTLWVVERGGRIRLLRGEVTLPDPFLDLSGTITAGGEQGLLGLAFDPDY